ncbi:MAG: PIG-L deacetylase family protein [Lachnospiraceae bacterium]
MCKKKAVFLLLVGGITMIILLALYPYRHIKSITAERLEEIDLSGYDKLMIVAHPDDEMLWGGAHLIEDDYFVICITGGDNAVRKAEFTKAMQETGDKSLILSYPDKVLNKRSKWTFCKGSIKKDIETVLDYKDWKVVVTHNEKGEYGHIQHIMTHELVVKGFDNTKCHAKRYFFGQYYAVDNMPDGLNRVNEISYRKKREILKCYYSQRKVIRKLYHMVPYELWEN